MSIKLVSKENKEFVQQQLYRETVDKIDALNKRTGQTKVKLYERAVSRLYNSVVKKEKKSHAN